MKVAAHWKSQKICHFVSSWIQLTLSNLKGLQVSLSACVYLMCVKKSRDKADNLADYLLASGLSLICMVLSSWLFVLGRLKLLFFLWRREQHELRLCGDEDSEEEREPALFTTEISMQLAWNVCSSTNSWFCGRIAVEIWIQLQMCF